MNLIKKTRSILEWEAYGKLVAIKNNYLQQAINYLQLQSEITQGKIGEQILETKTNH